MSGLGISAIKGIVVEVCEAIVRNLWQDTIPAHHPATEGHMTEEIIDVEGKWQFPCCCCAVDCCHIFIKCPD